MFMIFINYRTSDEAFAAAYIEDALTRQFGAGAVFRGAGSIPIGAEFPPVLWGALARAGAMLVVIGSRWLAADTDGRRRIDQPDDYVREEIALGLKIGIPVIPVLVGDAELPSAADLPASVRDLVLRQYVRFNDRSARSDAAELVDRLVAMLAPQTPPAASAPGPGTVVAVRVDADDINPALRSWGDRAVLAAVGDLAVGAPATVAYGPDATVLRLAPGAATAVGGGLVSAVDRRIAEFRALGVEPLRLLIAVAHGTDVDGYAVRLVNAPALTHCLAAAPGASMVAAVTDEFFDRAMSDRRGVDVSSYLAADLGDELTAWVRVPGCPSPPGLRPRRRSSARPAPAAPAPAADSAPVAGHITVHGDYVQRDKNNYHFGGRPHE